MRLRETDNNWRAVKLYTLRMSSKLQKIYIQVLNLCMSHCQKQIVAYPFYPQVFLIQTPETLITGMRAPLSDFGSLKVNQLTRSIKWPEVKYSRSRSGGEGVGASVLRQKKSQGTQKSQPYGFLDISTAVVQQISTKVRCRLASSLVPIYTYLDEIKIFRAENLHT